MNIFQERVHFCVTVVSLETIDKEANTTSKHYQSLSKLMAVGIRQGQRTQAHQADSLLQLGKPHVFVVGGLTFLGRNLIPALIKAGYGVKSMASTIEQRARLRALGCSSVGYGEPYSLEAIRVAARGSLYAVHCASAFVHCDVSQNDIVYKSNNLITTNMIKACRILRIVKLIVQSSEAVLYDGYPLQNVNEKHPLPLNPLGSCARSMQNVEDLVLGANRSGLRTVIVRPRLLWGRDDEVFLPSLLENARSGNLRLVGEGKYLTSTCHVANACEGIICAITYAKGGEVFFLTDGKPIVFQCFVRSLLTAAGEQNVEETISRSIPLWLAGRLARVTETLGRASGTQPRMTQSGIGLIGQEMTFVDAKARQQLGYDSLMSIERGLQEIHTRMLRERTRTDLGQEF